MNALIFLIIFPLFIAGLALIVPLGNALRKIIGVVATVVLSMVPIYLLFTYIDSGPVYFQRREPCVNTLMLAVEILIAAFIVYISLKAKRYLPVVLVVVQSVIMVTFELTGGSMEIEHSLFVDKFSIIMALIVGIIGSAICLYGIGYLAEYHEHHKEVKDRPRYFFFPYVPVSCPPCLASFFPITSCGSIFFWEITTICSVLLIGYKKRPGIP